LCSAFQVIVDGEPIKGSPFLVESTESGLRGEKKGKGDPIANRLIDHGLVIPDANGGHCHARREETKSVATAPAKLASAPAPSINDKGEGESIVTQAMKPSLVQDKQNLGGDDAPVANAQLAQDQKSTTAAVAVENPGAVATATTDQPEVAPALVGKDLRQSKEERRAKRDQERRLRREREREQRAREKMERRALRDKRRQESGKLPKHRHRHRRHRARHDDDARSDEEVEEQVCTSTQFGVLLLFLENKSQLYLFVCCAMPPECGAHQAERY
jgi:hypothetical protein